jgi:adenine deaminase
MNGRWLKGIIDAARDRQPTFVLKNANVVNVFSEEILRCDVALYQSTIIGLGSYDCDNAYDCGGAYLCPGLIDSHIHVESTMSVPWEFARLVMPFGTTMAIADPNEIANVMGVDGIRFMIRASERIGMDIYYMFPSSVPAASFEQNNVSLGAREAAQMIWEGSVYGMGGLMDYDAVISADHDMLKKLELFDGRNIDGHAPGLTGDALNAYVAAGVCTDRESTSYTEILEKLRAGMYIQLRVGSAANNISRLLKKIVQNSLPLDRFLFCSGDKHGQTIRRHGHLNHNLRIAVSAGVPPVKAVKMATLNAAAAYRIAGKGALAPGYDADIVMFEDLESFKPKGVFVMGKDIRDINIEPIADEDMVAGNSVNCAPLSAKSFRLPASGKTPVMEMVHGRLTTKLTFEKVPSKGGLFSPDGPYAKIAVVERHNATGSVGAGVVKNFGLAGGALATTVSHGSHNIIVVGTNDEDMLLAVNELRDMYGGYALVREGAVIARLPLPVAGLMSARPYEELTRLQDNMLGELAAMGVSRRSDPLSRVTFFSAPTIPAVRITTLGLYDVTNGRFLDGIKT